MSANSLQIWFCVTDQFGLVWVEVNVLAQQRVLCGEGNN